MDEATAAMVDRPGPLETREDCYRTIVIDPPWPGPGAVPAFDGHKATRVALPYACMTGIQVAHLAIPKLAHENGQIFIWATTRGLGDATLLMQGWGFKHRGLFVWKKRLGLGRHMRHECEFLLWGGRAGAPIARQKHRPRQFQEWPSGCEEFDQIQSWPQRGHSQKPGEAYEMIAQLSEGPRLDIFAREHHAGFEPWGNEIIETLGVEA